MEIDIPNSISKNLEILVNEGILLRVARGIYYLPKIAKQMGALLPDIEQVSKSIAEREKARIVTSGLSALQKLGLYMQVPLKAVYYTVGSPRKLKIGKTRLIFKRTTTRNLALKGTINSLIVRALIKIGKDQVTDHDKLLVTKKLKDENNEQNNLNHTINNAHFIIWTKNK